MARYLVYDIETVVDPGVWTPPDPPAPAIIQMRTARGPEEGILSAPLKDAFPPPHCWRPIVIGCVLLEESPGGDLITKRIGAIDASKEGHPDTWERAILQRFADVMGNGEGVPDLVTWNGRAFDVPTLMMRSMRYGISHGWYYRSRDTRYRFTEAGHCDLADAMGDYGAARHMGLDGMGRLIGLPGKFGDISGKNVAEAFAAGRHEDIRNYCVCDAVTTAFLFMRWQLLKGNLDADGYRVAAHDLLAKCRAEERLKEFCALVDRRVLLLEEPAPALAEAAAATAPVEPQPAPSELA